MTTIEQAFFDAVLSDISYVDGLTKGMTDDVLASIIKKRISAPLANTIGKRFAVLDVKYDPASGYQGVIFQDKVTKQLYLANCGTEPTDLMDWLSDGNLAFITGVASAQTVAMINWWEQISRPAGTSVPQIKKGIISQFTDIPPVSASGKISGALAQSGGQIRVVGHSLGGHLTTIFASLFSNQVSHSSTFNGAGLFSIGTSIFTENLLINFLKGEPLTQLAGLIGSTVQLPGEMKQDNFYAYNGLSVATNDVTFTQIGKRIGLFNEKSTFPINNHLMYKLTDALDLMRVIEILDPTITLDNINKLFEAASSDAKSSNESVLDSLRKIFFGSAVTATPVFDSSGAPARATYHQNIQDLLDDLYVRALQGQLKVDLSSSSLNTLAKSQLSALVSLLSLSPLVLSGVSQETQATLDTKLRIGWGKTYDQWTADQALTDAQRAAGLANFSDQFLQDRAVMLAWVMKANTENRSSKPLVVQDDNLSGDSWFYDDRITGTTMLVHPSGFYNSVNRNVVFGKDSADTINGGLNTDRLYGGGGNDTIDGKAGDDYIEGGTGDDTITGGKGNDILVGGAGFDTYKYKVGDGNDQIIDSGDNRIIVDFGNGYSETIDKFYKTGEEVWTTRDGKVEITHHSPWQIVLEDGSTIQLGADFQEGDYGIDLLDAQAIPTNFDKTITGDLAPKDFDPNTDGVQTRTDDLGNIITDPDTPATNRDDILYDSDGSDKIVAGGGDDSIYQLKGGDDWIVCGDGRDGIWSSASLGALSDKDIIEGNAGADMIMGGQDDDQLFGEDYGDMSTLINAGETARSINEQGDLVSGNQGNDYIYGSDRNDALFGWNTLTADNYAIITERRLAA